MRRTLVAVTFFMVLLGLWQFATLSGRWSSVLLPSPAMVGEYLWEALRDGSLTEAIEVTLRRLLV
ncbi:MAG: ABC transporter permease, partial [Pseudolabrys sp.]